MLNVDYDRRADVLYISKGQPVSAYGEQDDDGLLVRSSIETGEPVGLTVFKYRRWAAAHRSYLIERISVVLGVETREAVSVLKEIDNEINA